MAYLFHSRQHCPCLGSREYSRKMVQRSIWFVLYSRLKNGTSWHVNCLYAWEKCGFKCPRGKPYVIHVLILSYLINLSRPFHPRTKLHLRINSISFQLDCIYSNLTDVKEFSYRIYGICAFSKKFCYIQEVNNYYGSKRYSQSSLTLLSEIWIYSQRSEQMYKFILDTRKIKIDNNKV